MERKTIRIVADKIAQLVYKSSIDSAKKIAYIERLTSIDNILFEEFYSLSTQVLTNLDLKYIICFASDITIKDISLLFDVEPASVRTSRYRIKKKLGENNSFKLLL